MKNKLLIPFCSLKTIQLLGMLSFCLVEKRRVHKSKNKGARRQHIIYFFSFGRINSLIENDTNAVEN